MTSVAPLVLVDEDDNRGPKARDLAATLTLGLAGASVTPTGGVMAKVPDVLARADGAAIDAGLSPTSGLMTPDLTRRALAASVLASAPGSVGGALAGKVDRAAPGVPDGRTYRAKGGVLVPSSREAAALRNVLENASLIEAPDGPTTTVPVGGTAYPATGWYGGFGGGGGRVDVFAVDPAMLPVALRARYAAVRFGVRIVYDTAPDPAYRDPVYGTQGGDPLRFTIWEHFGARNPLLFNAGTAITGVLARLYAADGYATAGLRLYAPSIRISDLTASRANPRGDLGILDGDEYRLLVSQRFLDLTTDFQFLGDTFSVPYRTLAQVDPAQNTQYYIDNGQHPSGKYGVELIGFQMEAGDVLGDFAVAGESLERQRCAPLYKGFGLGLAGCVLQQSGPGQVRFRYDARGPGEADNRVAPVSVPGSTYLVLNDGSQDYTATNGALIDSRVGPDGGWVTFSGDFSPTLPAKGAPLDLKATGNLQSRLFALRLV